MHFCSGGIHFDGMASKLICLCLRQQQNEAMKAAKLKIEEMQRLDDTHTKQLKLLQRTREELEYQIVTMNADYTAYNNGRERVISTYHVVMPINQ